VSDLNFFMRSAPTSTIAANRDRATRGDAWHREFGGNPGLAFIATQAAKFLSDPSKVLRLRRRANPDCSIILVAVNPRRS